MWNYALTFVKGRETEESGGKELRKHIIINGMRGFGELSLDKIAHDS